MIIYFKKDDIPKDIKAKYKTLDMAYIHNENKAILDELYNQNFRNFETVGKKDNIECIMLKKKDFSITSIYQDNIYFDFLKKLTLKYAYVVYGESIGYYQEFIENSISKTSNKPTSKISILIKYESNKTNIVTITIPKIFFDKCNFQLNDIIPILRDEQKEYITLDMNRFLQEYQELLNTTYDKEYDFGFITDIKENEFDNYLNRSGQMIYYKYSNGAIFKFLNLQIYRFKNCNLKIGDKIYLKSLKKGYRIWDYDLQIEMLNKPELHLEEYKPKIDYKDLRNVL